MNRHIHKSIEFRGHRHWRPQVARLLDDDGPAHAAMFQAIVVERPRLVEGMGVYVGAVDDSRAVGDRAAAFRQHVVPPAEGRPIPGDRGADRYRERNRVEIVVQHLDRVGRWRGRRVTPAWA